MKKIFTILLMTLLSFNLFACGGGKPKDMSEESYDAAKGALETIDSYIAGNLSDEETDRRLNDYYEILVDGDDSITQGVRGEVLGVQIELSGDRNISEIKKYREEIADYIGE